MSEDDVQIGMYDVQTDEHLTRNERNQKRLKGLFDNSFTIVQGIVTVMAIFVILYLVLITPHQVDGISMDPTFKNQEYLIASKVAYKLGEPQRGDVIIFKFSNTRDFIKRVVAVPGDSIKIVGGQYEVNGQALDEYEYLSPTVYTDDGAFLHEGELLLVPDGQVFVSGDNREYSSDSRAFGPIEISQIKGKVFVVVYPIGDFRIIKTPSYN